VFPEHLEFCTASARIGKVGGRAVICQGLRGSRIEHLRSQKYVVGRFERTEPLYCEKNEHVSKHSTFGEQSSRPGKPSNNNWRGALTELGFKDIGICPPAV
jgi:hypothetical protein